MKKPIWNIDSVKDKCEILGLKYLSDSYKHDIKGLYQCSCGKTFERLFLNVIKGQVLCLECVKEKKDLSKKTFLLEKFNEFKKYVEQESGSNCIVLSKSNEYKSNKSKIKMVCSCGNNFSPTANNFMRGHHNCTKCSYKEIGKMKRFSKEEIKNFVESEGCTLLDYQWNGDHRLTIKCEKHEDSPYDISYANFYTGHRCPLCKESKGEKRVRQFLLDEKIKFKEQFGFDDLKGITGRILKFDFAILNDDETVKMLIEFDGEQHFKPKFGEKEFSRTVRNDALKNIYCNNKSIKLLRIPYTEFDSIEELIINNMAIPR